MGSMGGGHSGINDMMVCRNLRQNKDDAVGAQGKATPDMKCLSGFPMYSPPETSEIDET